ncbi:D-alanyl-D-alanine carboxypeptidase family protein [Rhizohabitans arisaemae]|uniref:D-alanyl-D-alanine carboxypeptidase family protein n=1 Tax=Rhizohabitans arisaemae TaxID=2720610 RepID=UPI0024B207B9|nr:D-alanyl-D-alanine carboxypeptidase family protein [Rhizohabitans arisaemae]
MPSPRSAGLIAVFMAMIWLVTGVADGTARATADPTNLTELRREAEKHAKAIELATKALEQRQAKLKVAQQELSRKLKDLQAADGALAEARRPLAELIGVYYQQPIASNLVPFLFAERGAESLQTLSDLNYLALARQSLADKAGLLLKQREALVVQAQELRAGNLLAEAQIAVEIETLKERSAKVVKALTQALVKLGIKIDRVDRAALVCDPTKVRDAEQYPNGLLPSSYLCPLTQSGERLRADAAIAFISLNEAYKQRFGAPICVTDSYRSLPEQQAVYYSRPGLAAVPGRSNHGLGLAVDLCGGVQNFRSVQFNWLEQNGRRYGWIHPDWAKRSPFEPWHWEYEPKTPLT